jgi:hypothetical protein
MQTDNSAAVLEPLARAIERSLAVRPEHFVTHPSELRVFQSVSDEALREFAHAHGWRVVRRVGGRRIEFYNDARMRQERLRTGNPRPEDMRFE